ncbi:hypothetical protein WDU94_015429, partial [Cyamophila willieti]
IQIFISFQYHPVSTIHPSLPAHIPSDRSVSIQSHTSAWSVPHAPTLSRFTRPGTYDLQARMQLAASAESDANNFATQDMKTDSILILSDASES